MEVVPWELGIHPAKTDSGTRLIVTKNAKIQNLKLSVLGVQIQVLLNHLSHPPRTPPL
jgi:hypothetical protein